MGTGICMSAEGYFTASYITHRFTLRYRQQRTYTDISYSSTFQMKHTTQSGIQTGNKCNHIHHTIWYTDRKQGQPYTPYNLFYRQETRATIYTIQSGLQTGNKGNHIHHTIWSTDRKQVQPYTPHNLVYRQETSAAIYTVDLNV